MVSSEEEDNNDHDSTSSSDSEEKELENRAATLEQEISNNKYIYDVHVELVELYRKLEDLKSMRAAYQRFADHYPLTSTIWLAWLKDEIKLQSPSTLVLSLFEKAVEDYLSIDVWIEYIQYCIGNCELEETYRIIENGLNAGGLHVSEGSLLWDVLRELELAQLILHKPLTDAWKRSAQKVFDAFKRQLSVPLLNMENTYAEWQEWLKQLPEGHAIESKSLEWGYHKSLKLVDTYKPFEEQLLNSQDNEEAIANVYNNYINATTDPATCVCLYERAVTRLSLNTAFWSGFCLYTFRLGLIAGKVSSRAVRNCPWDENLWVLRLRILEQLSYSDAEVMSCLEQGLVSISPSPGLNLWLSYLEFMRRSLNTHKHINKVFAQAAEQLGEDGDPTFKILRLQARLCCRNGDIAQARKIWSQIMRNPTYKRSSTAWIEYAALEKQFGDAHHLRLLYDRAIAASTDWAQYIADDWLLYERECGTLQDVLKCEDKCKTIAVNMEMVVDEPSLKGKKRAHDSSDKNAMVKRMKTVEISTPPHNKRVDNSEVDSEKSVFLSNMSEDVGETKLKELFPNAVNISIPNDRQGHSRCYAYVQFSNIDEVESALKRDREPIDGRPLYISRCLSDQSQRGKFKYSTKGEENKLFVRGLPLRFTQPDLEKLFKPHGAVAVRLVLRKNGRSKGLAYIEFSDNDKTKAALQATDQSNIEGHIITVAISAPPPKKDILTVAEPIRHARSRLQVPLIPRSIQAKKVDETVNIPSKSNEDFRKMLFNK